MTALHKLVRFDVSGAEPEFTIQIEDEAGTRLELIATRDQLDQMADTLDDILLHDSATDEEP